MGTIEVDASAKTELESLGSLASLQGHYRETMAKGSKSFSLAALLFGPEERVAARYLYSWCRHCDDAVDNATNPQEARLQLEKLRAETTTAFSQKPGQKSGQDPAFLAFGALSRQYSIPQLYPQELLNGMQMDVDGFHYQTTDDLNLYCYRVAGVVGLMMVHVMGVSSEKALKPALATGLAMQMTNIARDIKEDFMMGRIYIPKEWFIEMGITPPSPRVSTPASKPASPAGSPPASIHADFDAALFREVVRQLVGLADSYYATGREGLKYLPFRAALAVASAQEIYREIGVVVLKRGEEAWNTRTVVSLPRKLWLLGKAISRVFATIPARLISPMKRAPLKEVWGPEKIKNLS